MRKGLTWLHRYVGLTIALFLVLVGLTGSLLAFFEDLDAFAAPRLPARAIAAATLAPVVLAETVEAAHPALKITTLPLQIRGDRALKLAIVPRQATNTLPYDEIFVDPRDATLLGARKWGDLSEGLINLMPFVYRLHYSLALGQTGETVLGLVALLWTLDCFVGFYLTLPSSPTAAPKRKSWGMRWWRAWQVRRGARGYRLHFDWHRASGLWIWPLLFVLAWSGVGLNLTSVYNPTMRALLAMNPAPPGSPALSDPALSWPRALAIGRKAMAEEADRHGLTLGREVALRFASWAGEFRYSVHSSADPVNADQGDTTIVIDPMNGVVRRFDEPASASTGDIVNRWLYYLHFARVGGTAYAVFLSAMGVVIALLSVTGLLVWWKKRKARVRARAA